MEPPQRLRILLAPQALKGSLDATEAGAAMALGVQQVYPDADIIILPVSDGGEGLTTALVSATGGERFEAEVTGPLGEPVRAMWGILGERRAYSPQPATSHSASRVGVIEMAAAAGLLLVPPERRDPTRTTTRGVGELMLRALATGCDELIIGIGGSATNDGGAGMAQALGARLLDASGANLAPGGGALAHLARIEMEGMDPRLGRMRITVASDVTNPLCGPEGASAIYGPQKGATPAMVAQLDAALSHYADIIARDLGRDVRDIPGAGAAGGLGAGLLAFTQAKLQPGARLALEVLEFQRAVEGVALVLAAEGRLDAQTAYGKAVGAVATEARRAGARVIALAGEVAIDDGALDRLGIDGAVPLASGPLTLEESMARASELLTGATARALRLIRLGERLHQPGAAAREPGGTR